MTSQEEIDELLKRKAGGTSFNWQGFAFFMILFLTTVYLIIRNNQQVKGFEERGAKYRQMIEENGHKMDRTIDLLEQIQKAQQARPVIRRQGNRHGATAKMDFATGSGNIREHEK